jgi:nitrite reductase/ring-hydroxylating ferredoxin subunit
MRRISFSNRGAILLCRVQGQVYAIDDRCSHGKVFLSRGTLDRFTVTCPAHFGSFDVRTGAPIAPPCVDPVAAYCVNESESVLYLEEK